MSFMSTANGLERSDGRVPLDQLPRTVGLAPDIDDVDEPGTLDDMGRTADARRNDDVAVQGHRRVDQRERPRIGADLRAQPVRSKNDLEVVRVDGDHGGEIGIDEALADLLITSG